MPAARATEISDKLGDLDQEKLPSFEEARDLALELRPRDDPCLTKNQASSESGKEFIRSGIFELIREAGIWRWCQGWNRTTDTSIFSSRVERFSS